MAQGPSPPYNPQPPQAPPPGYAPGPPQQAPYGQPAYGQPAPGMAPAPPPKQGMSMGVTIAIIGVVVVVVLALIPAILYVMVTGVVDSPGPGPTHATVSLSVGSWSGGSTTVYITSVSTSTLHVDALAFQVVAPNGTIYFSGAAGQGTPVNGISVRVTYNDASSDNRAGVDDNIALSVEPAVGVTQIHGTTFKVLQGSDVLGTAMVP